MSEPFLENRVCIVTGGAEGIGWAISEAFASQGGQVYICDISAENLGMARKALEGQSWASQVHLQQLDILDFPAFHGWLEQIYAQTGRVDVLVNNAVYLKWDTVAAMSIADHERSMDVAYRGMVYSIKTVLPWMQAAGSGHIVNLSSSAGRVLVSGLSAAYASCKAAIDAYTQILQEELKGTPIHVLLVRPAIVGGTQFFGRHVPPTAMPRLADFVPYLTPPDVADGIIRALRRRQRILDIPGFLPLFYLTFDLAPGFLRWLMSLGDGAHTDFGNTPWKYKK